MTDATETPQPRHSGTLAALHDRAWALRDGLMRSARFQRWAARFPLTRPVARRQARAAFDLCAGFVYSQILTACVELDLLQTLAATPQTAAALATQAAMTPAAMERLLAAAAALHLVARRRDDRWGLGMTGAAIAGTPGLAEMIRHHALLYSDLRDPVALLRNQRGGTQLGQFWPYATAQKPSSLATESVAKYSDLMTRSQAMICGDIIDSYGLGRHRKLMDVGGGEGAFLGAVSASCPKLRLALFDLPAVTARATHRLASIGLAARVQTHGGDFFKDPLPSGADVISLIRILHDHDDAAALGLLRNVHSALPRGGTLLLAEPMSETTGDEATGDAYFGFYLLAMGSGRPRSPRVLQSMLRSAGFTQPQILRTARPMLVRAITARA